MVREHRNFSIADQIFEQLEKDILIGKYQRGEILSEMRLSEELGVSRTPIREALGRLVQEHILSDTGRGVEVVGISRADMLDMYEIRAELEGKCAAKAAKVITDDQLEQMKEILDLQLFYIEKSQNDGTDNSGKIKDLDSQFHQLLYASCGSNPYRDTLTQMHRKIIKFRTVSVRKKSRAMESQQEHMAIYDALKAHDPIHAEIAALAHVSNARLNITATVTE